MYIRRCLKISWERGTYGSNWRQIPPPPPIRCDQGIVPPDVEHEPAAFQVMIGLIHGALGRIWLFFYTRQFASLSRDYKPMALLSGYPFWTFLFFIISGVLAIETEKKRSPNLLNYAIRMNMSSFLLAVVGLILIGFEIILFLLKRDMIFWQEKTAMILSVYLWIFSIMELIMARKVVKWGKEAFYCRRYVIRP